jgi:hypothetical protein
MSAVTARQVKTFSASHKDRKMMEDFQLFEDLPEIETNIAVDDPPSPYSREDGYHCRYCPKVYHTRSGRWKHEHYMHPEDVEDGWVCKYCKHRFWGRQELQKHLSAANKNNGNCFYFALAEGYTLPRKCGKNKKKEKMFRCFLSACEKSFDTKAGRITHMQVDHLLFAINPLLLPENLLDE